MIEQRNNTHEIRIDSDTGSIMGLAAVFYRASNKDTEFDLFGDGMVSERIMDTAFDRALAEGDDVVALFNHDPNFVLGSTAAGTLELAKTKRGLAYEISPPDAQWARDLRETIRRGDINGSSFQFSVPDDSEHQEWIPQKSGRMVREIISVGRLVDVSPVTFPAYKATKATARERELRSLVERHQPQPVSDRDHRQRKVKVLRYADSRQDKCGTEIRT